MIARGLAASLCAAVLACSPAVAHSQSVPPVVDSTRPFRELTLAHIGYPDGVPLEGATAAGSVSFPLPNGVRLVRGLLELSLNITRVVGPGSNIQVFLNGTRRLSIQRSVDTATNVHVVVPLLAGDLARATAELQVRSYLAVGRDRCMDERLGSAYAAIMPESNLQYEFDPVTVRTPQALWSLLRDTVRVALPSRALTGEEFRLAYELGLELRADSRAERFVKAPERGDLSLDSIALIRDLLAWRKLVSRRGRVMPENPTFAQLGLGDLSRLYGYRAAWRLPVDLRILPSDRVPSGLDLDVASAATSSLRGVQYFVHMNGTLLRTFVGTDDGRSQRLHVDLPLYLLTTYNEVRVEVQRHRDQADYCQEAEVLYPAQILPSSILGTTRATNEPRLFTGTALRLAENFPLYLPRAALTSGEAYLSALVSLSRGTWGNRSPRFELYDREDAVLPKEAFVAIGSPRAFRLDGPAAGDATKMSLRGDAIGDVELGARDSLTSVVQVGRINKQTGVVLSLSAGPGSIPQGPESYGNADVVIASPERAVLRVNTRSLPAEVLYGGYDWLHRWAWTPQEIVGIAIFMALLATLIYLIWLRDWRAQRRLRKTP
ncbi:MAG: hypothetical protein JWM95_764 [Gemmatimonadetes bacterium]|nr:hypothetical protein [Gemmatimonadota bacterium]